MSGSLLLAWVLAMLCGGLAATPLAHWAARWAAARAIEGLAVTPEALRILRGLGVWVGGTTVLFAPADTGLLSWLLAGGLLVLGWIDARSGYLPDVLTWPGMALGVGVAVLAVWLWPGQWISPTHALLGAVFGYGVLWGIASVYARWRGIDGLGGGDLKLLGLIGAWLGWQALPFVVLVACLLTGAWALISARRGGDWRLQAIPFGPGLAAGAMVLVWLGGGDVWLVWLSA